VEANPLPSDTRSNSVRTALGAQQPMRIFRIDE
jgi:hypothetical protein